MRKATKHVLKTFPCLEKHAKNEDVSKEEVLKSLLDEEKVAMKMIWFFETPKSSNFDLKELYEYLTDSHLINALQAVNIFFLDDTYLINEEEVSIIREPNNPYLVKDEKVSIIREEDEYLNKASFARFLTENGVSFSRAKLSMYDQRGVLPKSDLVIGKVKYWKKETCEGYLEMVKQK